MLGKSKANEGDSTIGMHATCCHFSCVRLFATPWTVASRLLCPWDFPGKNTGMGCHALLQGIFSTQGLNRCLLLSRGSALFSGGKKRERALYFFNSNIFILIGGELLYNIVLVLPYINMNPPHLKTTLRE